MGHNITHGQKCLQCRHPMAARGHRDMASFFFVVHVARGLCEMCYQHHHRHGTLDNFPRAMKSSQEVLAEFAQMSEAFASFEMAPMTMQDVARHLSMTVQALETALHRALDKGDARAQHDDICTRWRKK